MDLGISNRKEVLEIALIVESLTSFFLASLLGIKNYTDSKSLGNTNSSLSLNQKIDLLIDIAALSKDDKAKFAAFMEIRNQFMHNIEANTYEKCFSFMSSGKDKYFLKTYPQPNTNSQEERLRAATIDLCNDIMKVISALKENLEEKIGKDSECYVLEKSQRAIKKSIDDIKKGLNTYFDKEIAKSEYYEAKKLKGLGSKLSKMLYERWKFNYENIDNSD